MGYYALTNHILYETAEGKSLISMSLKSDVS